MKNKKAQVTLFVIIGAIILIAAGLFIVITTKQTSEKIIAAKIAEIPVEFQPINDFVESCIYKTGKQGIKKIGFHGGYTDLNRYGIKANIANPTQSSAFLFNTQDTDSGIAYWRYFKSDNKCETGCECGSEQPHLYKNKGSPSIEKQLEYYIEGNLDNCLDDFNVFTVQGYNIQTISDIKTSATVRDNDVMFYVKYKIKAEKNQEEFEIEEFIETVPVNLKKIYELANDIKQSEDDFTYLERWTIEQISGLGLGLNENRLPPIAASELSPNRKPAYWIKNKVKDDIQTNMLPLYTPFLSIFDTKNYNYNQIGTFYERATLPIESEEYSYDDLEVRFNYLDWWPIYFDITGRGIDGQRIGPETASSSLFSFIGIKRYNFYYDLSYPVLVDIYDESAFNNEGLHFYLGLEANVRNNRALNCTGPGLTKYASPSGSLFCNYDQGCADITIETIDASTQKPLENVIIYYSSGTESCNKGFTEIQDNKAILKAPLPQCVGPACSLNAVKEGYWHYPKTYAVRCNKLGGVCLDDDVLCNKESLKLELEPYKNPNIIIMKKRMIKQSQKNWMFNNDAQSLLKNEYAVVSLSKIKDHADEEDLMLAGVFYGNQSSIKLLPGLVPGNYELNINLFYQLPDLQGRESITFKAVEECEDVMLGLDEECYTIGPYTFNETFVEGSITTNITITKSMLDNENLILYALSIPDIASSHSVLDGYDLEEIGKSEEYSNLYKVQLKPIVS